MITVMVDGRECHVPGWVRDLNTYLDWAQSDEFPDVGECAWIQGDVWVSYDMEDLFTHALVKAEIAGVLQPLVKQLQMGMFFPDGVLIANVEADLSCEPDGLFVSNESEDSGTVQFVENDRGGCTLLQGSPDMVLEIISRSSVNKDKIRLREAYWAAGVKEYWLVDARDGGLQFDILRHTQRGFQSVRKHGGWVKSAVFGKSFRLLCAATRHGRPEYSLEIG